MLVALDLGSVCGFAVKSKHGLSHGTINFKKKGKFSPRGYHQLYMWLCEFGETAIAYGDNLEIVVEKPHAGRFFAPVQILFGLMGAVQVFCGEYETEPTLYSPTEIKKYWTGKGTASKEEMVAVTQKKFPSVTDHNESDAIALLYLHLERAK